MLNWSIRLFRISGIQLEVHSTFFLLLVYVAWEGWQDAIAQHLPGYSGVLVNCAYLFLFFTCVVMHEFGHALTARRFGVGVRRILLLPIGGMAEFDSIPRKPSRELLITLAGPAVNFAIIGVLMIFAPFPTEQIAAYIGSIFGVGADPDVDLHMGALQQIMAMNLVMGCFNMIPVFPMDGGRVLRALLAMKFPYLKATFVAATIAKVLASLGVLLALFWFKPAHIQMAVLFGFILFAGQIEYRALKRREIEEEQWRQQLAQFEAISAARRPAIPHLPGSSS